jgi:hypothetical protein
VLDTKGDGRMVGLLLEVENPHGPRWCRQGDDMVFIDGEAWPPSTHGTGTEEIFGGGARPSREYASAYSGFHFIESPRFDGLVGMYRWYVHDPIHFARSLRWTIEHGHANNFASDYASVAYRYQSPLGSVPQLPAADTMLPPLEEGYADVRDMLFEMVRIGVEHDRREGLLNRLPAICAAGAPLYAGRVDEARAALEALGR